MLYARIVLFILLFYSSVSALNIQSKYPSASYVCHEFDIDESYLHDQSFVSFVRKNEKHLKGFYKRALKRGERLLPMMQGKLLNDGVSDLFIYLSMIESGFNTKIVSSKKAVGLWQFMPATAKDYNLRICKDYDERCNAKSATEAAIKHLNRLYKIFGKWYLAAMAYNCGEGCVNKAIKKAKSDDIHILTNNHLKYLPRETRDYIRKILLIAMIGESKKVHVNQMVSYQNDFIQVEIEGSTSLSKIAKLINMKRKALIKLNPKLQRMVKNKRYKLTIPLEKVYAFYLRYELPPRKLPKHTHILSHKVKLGDTLESLAKRYKTKKEDIMIANHLEYPFLTLDTLLIIPVSQKVFNAKYRK